MRKGVTITAPQKFYIINSPINYNNILGSKLTGFRPLTNKHSYSLARMNALDGHAISSLKIGQKLENNPQEKNQVLVRSLENTTPIKIDPRPLRTKK